jgi:hypothetical protein
LKEDQSKEGAVDNSVHFYHFDQSSGLLSEDGTPLPLEMGSGICPAEHL